MNRGYLLVLETQLQFQLIKLVINMHIMKDFSLDLILVLLLVKKVSY